MDIKETWWESVDRINLTQDGDKERALVNKVMSIKVT
jgi:hypothetical protein